MFTLCLKGTTMLLLRYRHAHGSYFITLSFCFLDTPKTSLLQVGAPRLAEDRYDFNTSRAPFACCASLLSGCIAAAYYSSNRESPTNLHFSCFSAEVFLIGQGHALRTGERLVSLDGQNNSTLICFPNRPQCRTSCQWTRQSWRSWRARK